MPSGPSRVNFGRQETGIAGILSACAVLSAVGAILEFAPRFLSKSPIFLYFVSKRIRKASGILFMHTECVFDESFGFCKPLKCPGKMSILYKMIEPS